MRRGDKILLIILVVFTALGYGFKVHNNMANRGVDGIAVIEVNGKVYGKYDLNKVGNKVINLELPDDEHSVVEFKDGMVRIREAGCPDKVCVRTGWISNNAEIIVCLPYRIVIKISGERQDVDVHAY